MVGPMGKMDPWRLRVAVGCAFILLNATLVGDDSGALEGQLRVAADAPVDLEGENRSVVDYARFFIVIRSADGAKEISRARPDASGNYRFVLPPGDYAVVLEQPEAKPVATAGQKFAIAPNKLTRVDTHVGPNLRKSTADHLDAK